MDKNPSKKKTNEYCPKESILKEFKRKYFTKKLAIFCLCLLLVSAFGFSNAFAASEKSTAQTINLSEVP